MVDVVVENRTSLPYRTYAGVPEYERVIDYETLIPLSYWGAESDVEPTAAGPRVNQMRVFQELYNGQYQRWIDDDIKQNYHRMIADFYADFLTGWPPKFKGEQLSNRFEQTLQMAIHRAITNMVRFGTALFQVVMTDWGPEVRSPDPITWYPASPFSDALIRRVHVPGGFLYYVHIYDSQGTDLLEIYQYNDMGKLGPLVDVVDNSQGSVADWDIIQENFYGRLGPIVNVNMRPSSGDWGRSFYPLFTDKAFEDARNVTSRRDSLQLFLNPTAVFTPLNPEKQSKPPEGDELKAEAIRLRFDIARSQPTMVLRGYKMEYANSDLELKDSFMHEEKVKEDIYAAVGAAVDLIETHRDKRPLSGVALDRHYFNTRVVTHSMMQEIKKSVLKVRAVGAVYAGYFGARLRAFIAQQGLRWENPLDDPERVNDVTDDGQDTQEREAPDVVSTE